MCHLLYFLFEKIYLIFSPVIKPDLSLDNLGRIDNSRMIPVYGSAYLFQGCAAIISAEIHVYVSWIRIYHFSGFRLKRCGIDLEILTYDLPNAFDRNLILIHHMASDNLFGQREVYPGLHKF